MQSGLARRLQKRRSADPPSAFLPCLTPSPHTQEYYEVLHSCIALSPAFASNAYYVNKGSSSIGASLISGTPLIAHRRMLKSYE